MALTKERKGEIALLYLRRKIGEQGINLVPGRTIKYIRNTAEEIGITEEEALEFAEGIVREIVEEVFSKK